MGGVKCSERLGWVGGGGTFRSLGVGSCSHERSPPKGPRGYHTPQAAMGCAQYSNAEIEADNETVAALRAIARDVHGRMPTTITAAEGDDRFVVQDVPRRKPEEIIARSADPAGQANACTLKKIRHHRTLPKSTILSTKGRPSADRVARWGAGLIADVGWERAGGGCFQVAVRRGRVS